MGICPYCKQHPDLRDVKMEKKGRGIAEQKTCICIHFVITFLDFLMQYDN